MPDPNRETISATQVAALFDASPYVTRWMLYQHFKDGLDIEPDESSRMKLGKRVQLALLDQAADDLAFAVTKNESDLYVRSVKSKIGCTRDAEVLCPDRGIGALELKTVWDYTQWMTAWGGGVVPRHIELQLQVQMMVGDGTKPFGWGVIGACVCGEMKYWERAPMAKLWKDIEERVVKFFRDIDDGNEPEPFGDPAEDPLMALLYPSADPEKEQDLDNIELGETARMYAWAKAEATSHKKIESALRPKLLEAAKDNGVTKLPGAVLYVKKSDSEASVVTLPQEHKRTLMSVLGRDHLELLDKADIEGLANILNWNHETRKAGVRTTVKVEVQDG